MEAYDFYRDVYHLKDEELIQKFAKATRRKKLKKGEFVVRIGEILNHVYFMESGILRGYFFGCRWKRGNGLFLCPMWLYSDAIWSDGIKCTIAYID